MACGFVALAFRCHPEDGTELLSPEPTSRSSSLPSVARQSSLAAVRTGGFDTS
ncbi:hypothetical protein ABZW30_36225 [Kitasatospora sp. NPDC004669]|uniref:hypothetical protein n=1 Tax=Kitasatospora sp. NPDC004669 TaxID=3154555 RepID=UPI0033B14520